MGALSSRWAILAAMGIAALGLVGLGARASYTDSITASQVIRGGTLSLDVDDSDGKDSGKHHLTWTVNSSGSPINEAHTWGLSNAGTLPLTITTLRIRASGGGQEPSPMGDNVTINFAGVVQPVTTLETLNFVCTSGCNLKPGETVSGIPISFTGDPGSGSSGQTITPTLTVSAVEWDGSGPSGGTITFAQV